MAGEFQAVAPTGSTVYAQVVDRVTGRIWSTVAVAFEAYLTANVANYAVAMLELGAASGIYVGNSPAAGNLPFLILYRVQAGGGPAEGDLLADRQEIGVNLADGVVHGGVAARMQLEGGDATYSSFHVRNTIAGGRAATFEQASGGSSFRLSFGDGVSGAPVQVVALISTGEQSYVAMGLSGPGYATSFSGYSQVGPTYAGFDAGNLFGSGGIGAEFYASDATGALFYDTVLGDGLDGHAIRFIGDILSDGPAKIPLAEAYAAPGVAPDLAQFLYQIWTMLSSFRILGVTLTTKKIDGTTDNMTFTFDSATAPSSIQRAT